MKAKLYNRSHDLSYEDTVETGAVLMPNWYEAERVFRTAQDTKTVTIEVDVEERRTETVAWTLHEKKRRGLLMNPMVQARLLVNSFGRYVIAIVVPGGERPLADYEVELLPSAYGCVPDVSQFFVWRLERCSADYRQAVEEELLERIRRVVPEAFATSAVPMPGFWVRTSEGFAQATWELENIRASTWHEVRATLGH